MSEKGKNIRVGEGKRNEKKDEEKIRLIRTEEEAWRYINKRKKKRK